MIIEAPRTPVVVTRTNSSRSRTVNLTGHFFCEPTTTVLSGKGKGIRQTPTSQPDTPQLSSDTPL
ncbi:hypothetical protein ACWEQ1_35970, partial [Streptomyces nodosus]